MKKPLTLKKLIELVTKEAINLKANATQEELDNLNFNCLLPSDSTQCIYGQMTGNCDSKRAVELIRLSCKRVMGLETIIYLGLILMVSQQKNIGIIIFHQLNFLLGCMTMTGHRLINTMVTMKSLSTF